MIFQLYIIHNRQSSKQMAFHAAFVDGDKYIAV